MRKIISLIAVATMTMGLVACSDDESSPIPNVLPDNKVEQPADLTETAAMDIIHKFSGTVRTAGSTEDDLRAFATDNYISNFISDNGSSFSEVQKTVMERDEYWNHDQVENETVSDVTVSGNTATSYRDLTVTLYSFQKAPQPDKCTIVDTWVAEDGQWKLDSSDTSDCSEMVGAS